MIFLFYSFIYLFCLFVLFFKNSLALYLICLHVNLNFLEKQIKKSYHIFVVCKFRLKSAKT